MKAMRIHQTGGPEVMQLDNVPTRAADAHHALEGRKTTGKVLLIP